MTKTLRVSCMVLALSASLAHAGLFDDDEARRAILDLRERVENTRLQAERDAQRATDDNQQLRRSLLDLQNQIEALRADLAKQQGQNEQLVRDISDLQRQQKDVVGGVEERLRKFEPVKVSLDGQEFTADPAEKKDFEAAFAIFRKGDFAGAQGAFTEFVKRYAVSGYVPSALFWLGNAQYAQRDYKASIQNFRNLLQLAPEHQRASEAVLSIANCQLELKDVKAARKTLEELIKAYPQTEAATAAKERLSRLK